MKTWDLFTRQKESIFFYGFSWVVMLFTVYLMPCPSGMGVLSGWASVSQVPGVSPRMQTNRNSCHASVQAPAGVEGGSGNWTGVGGRGRSFASKEPILGGREIRWGRKRQDGMWAEARSSRFMIQHPFKLHLKSTCPNVQLLILSRPQPQNIH